MSESALDRERRDQEKTKGRRCPSCAGAGFGMTHLCPSCGGSGVALDGIDMDRARRGLELLRQCIRPIEGKPRELLDDTLDTLDRLLAVYDGKASP